MEGSGQRVRAGGGRCMRARELARRRGDGEDLGELDRRRLDAHLSGCGRCREFATGLEPTVGGGKEPASPANVPAVEAAGNRKEHLGEQVDAMGQDKRRQVVGEGGPNRTRQFMYYGGAILLVIVLYFGAKIAVDELDKAPKNDADQAPWSKPEAPQAKPESFQ